MVILSGHADAYRSDFKAQAEVTASLAGGELPSLPSPRHLRREVLPLPSRVLRPFTVTGVYAIR